MRLFTSLRWVRRVRVLGMALVVRMMLASFQLLVQAQARERPVEHPTFYRTTQIDGLSIFCREAGSKDAATLRQSVLSLQLCSCSFLLMRPIESSVQTNRVSP